MAVNYKAIAKKLKFEGRAFINGKYVNAIDGKKFETINPATGEKLCTVAKCNHKDVDLQLKFQEKLLIVVFGQEVLQNIEKKFY
jgi:aldehyde dehydrogenase (NAD+)/gamma-glutamyl-gamma-aminobutyraldehyde dehydrogenase